MHNSRSTPAAQKHISHFCHLNSHKWKKSITRVVYTHPKFTLIVLIVIDMWSSHHNSVWLSNYQKKKKKSVWLSNTQSYVAINLNEVLKSNRFSQAKDIKIMNICFTYFNTQSIIDKYPHQLKERAKPHHTKLLWIFNPSGMYSS